MIQEVDKIFNIQSSFDNLQNLKNNNYRERIVNIKKIEAFILNENNHKKIAKALWDDLRKSNEEVISTEISPIILTIKHICRNLKSWMQDRHVPSPLTMAGMQSYIKYEPKGVVLIISPWNYPFQLSILPLVYAIAAGNAVILKPSEISSSTSSILNLMLSDIFKQNEVAVIQGGVDIATALLNKASNHIHFTGSPAVGKIVMKAASNNLTSVTLELGGKSPVIIDETANIISSTQKIAWAKCLNNGQTCVAPDYAFIHESKIDNFKSLFSDTINKFYNSENKGISQSPDYCRIINNKNYSRLTELIDDAISKGAEKISYEDSNAEDKFIAPTLLLNVNEDMRIMQEEIFGPILPIIIYNEISEVISYINNRPTPLASYIMSSSNKNTKYIIDNTSSGGTAVNELMVTTINPSLPFGGKNNSGIGKSNGIHSFIDFSNERGIVVRKWGNLKMIYPPYNAKIFKLFKKIIKL